MITLLHISKEEYRNVGFLPSVFGSNPYHNCSEASLIFCCSKALHPSITSTSCVRKKSICVKSQEVVVIVQTFNQTFIQIRVKIR